MQKGEWLISIVSHKEQEAWVCTEVIVAPLLHRFLSYVIDLCAPLVYNARMIFVETKVFTRRILDAMSDDEYASLQSHLADHPDAGAMIPGSGGVRKIRWGGSGHGKRGGVRLIYYWNFCDKILMLYVYLKNERENLTEEQKQLMKQIAKEYKHE